MLYTEASKNCSVNENSGPPKTCTFDVWPVTRKRLPTPDLEQGCVTGGPYAITRPAKPFGVALVNILDFFSLSIKF